MTPPAVQKWLKREAEILEYPEISAEITEMEFDEIPSYLSSSSRFVSVDQKDYETLGLHKQHVKAFA